MRMHCQPNVADGTGKMVCSQCWDVVQGDSHIKYEMDRDVFCLIVLHPPCVKPYDMAKIGKTHMCPKCLGEGKFQVPMSFGVTHNLWGSNTPPPCQLCEGFGYLEKAPIPVQVVTEWKKAE